MDLDATWASTESRYPYLADIRPLKTPYLFAVYNEILDELPTNPAVLELGIHMGGSLVLWNEAVAPRHLAGVDINEPHPLSPRLTEYLEATASSARVVPHWRTSQSDAEALRSIVAGEFGGRLDFVIDDASHVYTPTLASLKTLLPLVRPGGFYVIEDWGTDTLPDFHDPAGTMLDIVTDLAREVRDSGSAVAELRITTACVVIRKA